MTKENGTLRLRMVEPLGMDEATRTLTRAGLLVPLTDWGTRKQRFDTYPRGLGVLMALLVPVSVDGYTSSPDTSVSTPVAVGVGVVAFVLGVALEAWIVTHHPPAPKTPAQVLADVFGVDAVFKDGVRRSIGRASPAWRSGTATASPRARCSSAISRPRTAIGPRASPCSTRTACRSNRRWTGTDASLGRMLFSGRLPAA